MRWFVNANCLCVNFYRNGLGPAYNEIGYYEHPPTTSKFLSIKIIDSNVKKIGYYSYNEQFLHLFVRQVGSSAAQDYSTLVSLVTTPQVTFSPLDQSSLTVGFISQNINFLFKYRQLLTCEK